MVAIARQSFWRLARAHALHRGLSAMNETKPNIYQLHAMLDQLRKLDRAAVQRGNEFFLVTESLDDTIPDLPLPASWARS
jgi:hypothetical protein